MALNDSVISSVSCGELHTLFFDRKNGQVWCCGANEYGRLGGGPNWGHQDALVPQLLVDSFAGEKVAEVCAGFNHSIALTESGRIFAWGRNDQGQLGLGDSFIDIYSMEDMPRLIESEKLANQKVTQISAGKGTSAALTQEGKIFYWGHKVVRFALPLPYPRRLCTNLSKFPIPIRSFPSAQSKSKCAVTQPKVEQLFVGSPRMVSFTSMDHTLQTFVVKLIQTHLGLPLAGIRILHW
jgi:alpha-tubulin suppressor-like RCC1 family protein